MEKGRCACLADTGVVLAVAVFLCLSTAACLSLKDSGSGREDERKQGMSITGFMAVYAEDWDCGQDAFTSFTGLPGTPLPQEDRSAEEPISVCDGCEDVFLIKSSHIWGENVAQCASLYCPTFGHDEDHFWFYIAFASEFIKVASYHDAMLCSYYSWPGGGNAWYLMAADETEEAVLHRDGDDVVWSRHHSGAGKGWMSSLLESCESDESYLLAPSETDATTFRASGTLPCLVDALYSEEKQDVWEFKVTPGETVTLTIDTPSAETTFDPDGFLIGPDSCYLGRLEDAGECSVRICTDTVCPSTTFVAEESSYRLVVKTGSDSSVCECTSETAEYAIYLDAPTDPVLSLVYDDIPAYEQTRIPVSFSLSGFARITR